MKKQIIRTGHIGETDKTWDNGFYTLGIIFDMSIFFLIDSGSTASILSLHVFNKLPSEVWSSLTPIDVVINDVNGNRINTIGTLTLKVTLGVESFSQIFLVCEVEQDGIIGQDFLVNSIGKINYRTMVLHTVNNNEIQCWIGGRGNTICRVEVHETIQIPPMTSQMVKVYIPGEEHLTEVGYVEGISDIRGSIFTLPGIIETQKDEPYVQVINYTDKDVTLSKGKTIGTCEPYQEQTPRNCVRLTKPGQNISDKEHNTNAQVPEHLSDLVERSSKHLNLEQIEILASLLIKYQNVFSETSDDIGRTNLVTHRINTGNAIPIRQRPRRMPIGKRDIEKKEVQRMLESGIIEPSNSPWASNIVLVKKKDGKTRFCVDYRMLNDVTAKDAYPLPRVDDCLDSLAGSKWFGSMDLNSGFWQINMSTEDKEKTAFLTSLGLYQFTVMPFGLVNSPSTFERLMENVLRGLQWKELLLYMDDIISIANTFEDGVERLERIFQRLEDANLKLKPSKCIFFQKQVRFLGHIVSEEGISTEPEKISAVNEWPVPKSQKQVRSFLGLCSYYRRFVKDFSDTAKPLHKLCEKNNKFHWTPECQEAFDDLKEKLTTTPILAYPEPGLPFILDTDASNKSVGAVLSQLKDGKERVIAYMSKTMNVHEQAYCTTRKELLAVVKALRNFHSYLYGQEVHLRTDNAAVSWMKNLKKPTGQTARWLQELETYNISVTHRAGRSHQNADALSRRPCKSCTKQESGNTISDDDSADENENQDGGNIDSSDNEDSITENLKTVTVRVCTRSKTSEQGNPTQSSVILEGWQPDKIRLAQLEDTDIGPLLAHLEDGNKRPDWDRVSGGTSSLKTLWRQWDRLIINKGMLYRKFYNNEGVDFTLQLIVPKALMETLLRYYHDIQSAGHLGANKMIHRIQEKFYWTNMKRSVEDYCEKCDLCAARKPPKQRYRAPLGQYLVGEPMERVAIDILGPLPITQNNNRYILVLCDCFTKWTEAYAIPNQESETVAKVIVNEFISRFGTPLQIHSDQGQTFESNLFKHLCELLHIDKTRTTSQRPQANGNVERFNRTLIGMLSFYCQNDQSSWDESLPQLLMAYRSSIHASSGQTPNMMMLGRNITLPLEAVIPQPDQKEPDGPPVIEEYIVKLQDKLIKAHETARKNLKKNSDYQKRHYDLKATKRKFEVGQAVWLYDSSKKPKVCHKLTLKWKGPYIIVRRIDDVTYLVKRSKKTPAKAYHIDRLLPYRGRNPPSWFSRESGRTSI